MTTILEFRKDEIEEMIDILHKVQKCSKKLAEHLEEGEYNTRKHHSDYSDGEDEDEMRYRRFGGRYSRY